MFIFDITCEDTRVRGQMNENNVWDVICTDSLTGQYFDFECSCLEMGTIMKMMINDGDSPQEDYDLVEYLFNDCPIACRPIP
jgi:hypothetical protein